MKEVLSSVSPKGQITIPAEMRRVLGIKPRDKLAIILDGHELKVRPVGSPVDATFQAVPALKRPLSWKEIEAIAHEEQAQATAGEGLQP